MTHPTNPDTDRYPVFVRLGRRGVGETHLSRSEIARFVEPRAEMTIEDLLVDRLEAAQADYDRRQEVNP